jgi:hypothetical protein
VLNRNSIHFWFDSDSVEVLGSKCYVLTQYLLLRDEGNFPSSSFRELRTTHQQPTTKTLPMNPFLKKHPKGKLSVAGRGQKRNRQAGVLIMRQGEGMAKQREKT